jgi:hypothetical protein
MLPFLGCVFWPLFGLPFLSPLRWSSDHRSFIGFLFSLKKHAFFSIL